MIIYAATISALNPSTTYCVNVRANAQSVVGTVSGTWGNSNDTCAATISGRMFNLSIFYLIEHLYC